MSMRAVCLSIPSTFQQIETLMRYLSLPRRAGSIGLAAAALLAAMPAWSQQAGLYTGYTSQGQPIELQIGPSTRGGGVPALTFVQVVFQVGCESSGRVTLDGYAVSTDVPLNAGGGFSKQIYTARYQGSMRAVYNGSDGFTGSTSLYGAKLLPALPPVAEGCTATAVGFSVSRAAGQAQSAALPPPGLDSWTTGHWARDGRLRQERVQALR